MSTKPNKIFLTITNPAQLQPGATPRFEFDKTGGTIGSRGTNWILIDAQHRINPVHTEIKWLEGAFCVVDRSGDTRINGSDEGLGASHVAQLNDGDMLQIGPYKILVYFNDLKTELPDPTKSLEQHSVGELVNENRKLLTEHNTLSEEEYGYSESSLQPGKTEFDQMTSNQHNKEKIDPLAALDAQAKYDKPVVDKSLLDPTHFGRSTAGKTQPDYTESAGEAVSRAGAAAQQKIPDLEPHEWQMAYHQAEEGAQHIAGTPLQQGLKANLGSMDSASAYSLMLNAGKSLKAAIKGISKLYDESSDSPHKLAMLTRTLQPIEDNPLRLKQPYEDTVRAMLSEYRSAVHLSPSAAIAESLEQARVHNIAVIEAIGESLNALLKAFSPEVLEKRFERYNTNEETNTLDDGWAWRMYNHYYAELTSSRQQGFEKLFWEVFEQAYDRAMRERT